MFEITQIKSCIGLNRSLINTLRSLKLGSIGKKAVVDLSKKEAAGRVALVKHVLLVKEKVDSVEVASAKKTKSTDALKKDSKKKKVSKEV